MEDGEEGVSYETLQDLLRQERRSNKLMPVRNGFWSDLQDFLKAAEDEFRAEQAKDPWNRKAMMLSDRVKNARHAAETVWALRERKLAMLALAHAADGRAPDGLTHKEQDLYGSLMDVLRDGRRTVFTGTSAAPRPVPRPAATPRAAPAAKPTQEGTEEPPEAGQSSGPEPGEDQKAPEETTPEPTPRPADVPADTPEGDIVTIRALGDIPPFVGPDMDTYHLKEGDMASVPENIADLLVRRGKASVVQAT